MSGPIKTPKQLSTRLNDLRRQTLAGMLDKASAEEGSRRCYRQADALLLEHGTLCNPVAASYGLLSLAKISERATSFGLAAPPLLQALADGLLDLFIARSDEANSRDVSTALKALASLQIQPTDVSPEYESALAKAFIADQHSCGVQSASLMLHAVATLNINPLQGRLLLCIEDILTRELRRPDLDCTFCIQYFSLAMKSYARMRLHISPVLAQAIASCFHLGLQQGTDDPRGIVEIAWAWATLGYAIPPELLQSCKRSLQQSRKPFRGWHLTYMVWALGIYGQLHLQSLREAICRLQGKSLQVW